MNAFSICIIAKNEEANIRNCLEALLPLSSEIILLDTGSTDRTCEIAREYTPHIHSYTWHNDFSAARNECARHSSCDFVLMVDCDEVLRHPSPSQQNPSPFTDLLNSIQQQIRMHPDQIGRITRINTYRQNQQLVNHQEEIGRLYSRSLYHYQGVVHEQLVPISQAPNSRLLLSYYTLPLTFIHHGYDLAKDPAASEALLLQKARRNLDLLLPQLSQNASDPYLCYQAGQSYFAIKDYLSAIPYYQRGIAHAPMLSLDWVQTMILSYGYCLINTGQYSQALSLETYAEHYHDFADYHFIMGLVYMNHARFADAIQSFHKATLSSSCSILGTNGHLSYYNMGVIEECQGNIASAILFYRKCGKYEPALARLSQLEP